MGNLTTKSIAEHLRGRLVGRGDLCIKGAEILELAKSGDLSLIGDKKYAEQWKSSGASAALIEEGVLTQMGVEAGEDRALIVVGNVDLAMAEVLLLLSPAKREAVAGVHPSAVVEASARIAASASIGAQCYVGHGVTIGEKTVLHPNVTILDDVVIGEASEFFPGTVIRERCKVGDRCIFHPNVVIGADGFGYRPSADGKTLVKITHIGSVLIGSDVELGAGTCVDRGKFSDTMIGEHTKIDNLCQIGHNCRIGRCVVISGHTGVAGSVVIGDGVMIGGKTAIRDHVRIGNYAKIMGNSAVMSDVPAKATWGGYPAQEARDALREVAAVRKLPELLKLAGPLLKGQLKN